MEDQQKYYVKNDCKHQLSRAHYSRVYIMLNNRHGYRGRMSFSALSHAYSKDVSALLAYVRELESKLNYRSIHNE